MRSINYMNYNQYMALDMKQKLEFLMGHLLQLDIICKNGHAPISILTSDEDVQMYADILEQLKNETDKKMLVTRAYQFVSYCQSKKIHDRFILKNCIDYGVHNRLGMSIEEFAIGFIFVASQVADQVRERLEKEQDNTNNASNVDENVPKIEGEIISPAAYNRIINQQNLNNPPVLVVDAVAREVDTNGKVSYIDPDNDARIKAYNDVIQSNILLQDDFYLPESHMKNLVEVLQKPKFKETMYRFNMVPNKYGPDFTELRHYKNMDKSRYNFCMTARTKDKNRNIIVVLNTANIDMIGVYTDSKRVCNRSK